MSLTKEKIDEIAAKFITLREKAKVGSQKDKIEFKKYETYAMNEFSWLVKLKTNKYKKFSNYQDLLQDGFEALVMSLETYDPNRGCFAWWAAKYIGTRVGRTANAHSTIRVPIKKVKNNMPYKVSSMPEEINFVNPELIADNSQLSKRVSDALATLSEKEREVIMMHFEFPGTKGFSIQDISEKLGVSRPTCVKLIDKAKGLLKDKLMDI